MGYAPRVGGDASHPVNLDGAVLDGADMRNADFRYVSLKGAKLSNARLQRAVFNGANLTSAVAKTSNFRGANFNETILEGAQLDGSFFNADGTYQATQLNYAYMPNATLSNASLDGAFMTYVDLYGPEATVANATMSGVDFTNAILVNLHFGQHLENATLTGAVLIGAQLQGSHLQGAKLIGAHLEGANFDGAFLQGANLTHAVVAFEAGSYQVQVLKGDGTQDTRAMTCNFGATALAASSTDGNTTCPNGFWGPCDTPASLSVNSSDRPSNPPCVPSGTSFCPRRRAN